MVKKQKPPKPLRWRITKLRAWRESVEGRTLEAVVDMLADLPKPIKTTHASLGRIENGKQMPPVGLIEALAELYGTDVHSLLNRDPPPPDDPEPRLRELWDMADEKQKKAILSSAEAILPH